MDRVLCIACSPFGSFLRFFLPAVGWSFLVRPGCVEGEKRCAEEWVEAGLRRLGAGCGETPCKPASHFTWN